jgi:2-phospho-L-lactate/phosphoenolpyruvate guanylyltransferase
VSTLAVLPIKSFPDAKQRLRHELAPPPRRALAEAMFTDVLVALSSASRVDHVLVVTADRGAQELAAGRRASVLEERQQGHNAAAALAIRWARSSDVDRALLVPGDCPLIDPAEIDQLLTRPAASRSVLIVPDRHGTGTNALLLTPPDSLTPSFGPGSCERHVAIARSSGTEHEVVEVPSLALDIDTADDLAALQRELSASTKGAAHTRELLGQPTASGP